MQNSNYIYTNIKKRMSAPTNKSKPELPWWVELLFVQIGLPDRWLSAMLKKKKKISLFISENRSNIYYSVIIIFSLIYIYPVIRNSRLNNICINNASEIIQDSKEINDDKVNMKSASVAYCNGKEY